MTDTSRVFDNVLDAIGDTPIARFRRLFDGLQSEVYAKLEFMNPAGSVKDRIARVIVEEAERRGDIRPGGTIVEATSGNTGMGLAMVAAVKGYRCIFVMPDKQSKEKIQALRAFGAEVVVTPTAVEPDDPRSYYSVARKLARETPNAMLANQYHNLDNPKAHFDGTGPEIWRQMAGKIDVFVAGMGTGGTLTGVGRFLKSVNPQLKVVGVDPVGSLYYDYFKTGKLTEAYSYLLEGIGEDFLPSTMDLRVLDDVVRVSDRECFSMARDLVRKEGMFSGGSAGAAVAGALKWVQRHDRPGQRVLVLLPDTGRQYLGKVYNDEWMRENRMLDAPSQFGTVRDLLGTTPKRAVISVPAGATVREATDVMKRHDVSQLPVVEGTEVLGIVTEVRVLGHLVDRRGGGEDPVRPLAENTWSMVDPETTLPVLSDMFTRVKIVLVLDGREIVNVLTRIDLVDYLARVSR